MISNIRTLRQDVLGGRELAEAVNLFSEVIRNADILTEIDHLKNKKLGHKQRSFEV